MLRDTMKYTFLYKWHDHITRYFGMICKFYCINIILRYNIYHMIRHIGVLHYVNGYRRHSNIYASYTMLMGTADVQTWFCIFQNFSLYYRSKRRKKEVQPKEEQVQSKVSHIANYPSFSPVLVGLLLLRLAPRDLIIDSR